LIAILLLKCSSACHVELEETSNTQYPSVSSWGQKATNKKPWPGRTAGQRKGLSAEASFCLEFCFLLVKQKEEEKNQNHKHTKPFYKLILRKIKSQARQNGGPA